MAFNPSEHMMKLKGRDYLQVAWRLVWFREDHPDWALNADILEQDGEHAIFKAVICDENGVQKSSGHGSESKRDFGDYLEKAETKAIGRALAMLGYGTQFAADELDEGERIVDTPVDRAPKHDESENALDDQPHPLSIQQRNTLRALLADDEWAAMEAKYGKNLALMKSDTYVSVLAKIRERKGNAG